MGWLPKFLEGNVHGFFLLKWCECGPGFLYMLSLCFNLMFVSIPRRGIKFYFPMLGLCSRFTSPISWLLYIREVLHFSPEYSSVPCHGSHEDCGGHAVRSAWAEKHTTWVQHSSQVRLLLWRPSSILKGAWFWCVCGYWKSVAPIEVFQRFFSLSFAEFWTWCGLLWDATLDSWWASREPVGQRQSDSWWSSQWHTSFPG